MIETMKILVADDDPDDRMLIADAFADAELNYPVDFVVDGLDLISYLNREDQYEAMADTPMPSIILLDLNMPRMDGRSALEKIKQDPRLKNIPIIVLTTSSSEEDIDRCYDLGANSYITKPTTFDGLVEIAKAVKEFWMETVQLPRLAH